MPKRRLPNGGGFVVIKMLSCNGSWARTPICRGHVTHENEFCVSHMNEAYVSRMNESFVTHEWVVCRLSHTRTSRKSHIGMSRMSPIWMTLKGKCPNPTITFFAVYYSVLQCVAVCCSVFDVEAQMPSSNAFWAHTPNVQESHEWVMSHIWIGHVLPANALILPSCRLIVESCHSWEWVLCLTYEWVVCHTYVSGMSLGAEPCSRKALFLVDGWPFRIRPSACLCVRVFVCACWCVCVRVMSVCVYIYDCTLYIWLYAHTHTHTHTHLHTRTHNHTHTHTQLHMHT